MDEITADTKIVKVAKMDGVRDLPIRVRAKFAKALVAEAKGKHDDAAEYLNEAIAFEEEELAKD